MPKSFNLGGQSWKGSDLTKPRVFMRGIIGILLAANLATAVIALKPFGGSADDLRRQQQALSSQLHELQTSLDRTRKHFEKVKAARAEGDDFLAKYFPDERSMSETLLTNLNQMAKDAGIRIAVANAQRVDVEGSDTLYMLSIQTGLEGSYANLTKFVNLVDKSPMLLIIENMTASAPQQQGPQANAQPALSIALKIDTFVSREPGSSS